MSYQLTSHLTPSELPKAAALAAAAFTDTPCYNQIMPCNNNDILKQTTFLAWLFEKNFQLRLNDDCYRCTYDANKLISFFMFTKPDVRHPTCCDMLKVGLILGLWRYGFGVVRRLLATKSWFETKELELFGERTGTMIRLERMTVLPEYQGKGVGSFALKAALEEADALGLACILATQERRNVIFYTRLGFKVVDESQVPIGEGYENWFMIREAVDQKKVEELLKNGKLSNDSEIIQLKRI